MDFAKVSIEEARSFDGKKRREVATSIRKELASLRMDIYAAAGQSAGKLRGLKKSLARVLTAANEKPGKTVAPAKVKAKPAAKTKKKTTK